MLVEHAKYEMQLVGLFDKDADYNGLLPEAVIALLDLFASQGHSGGSAAVTIDLFSRLAKFENLSPLSDKPEEWFKPEDDVELWQSKRKPSVFSKDGGKTWYDLDDRK